MDQCSSAAALQSASRVVAGPLLAPAFQPAYSQVPGTTNCCFIQDSGVGCYLIFSCSFSFPKFSNGDRGSFRSLGRDDVPIHHSNLKELSIDRASCSMVFLEFFNGRAVLRGARLCPSTRARRRRSARFLIQGIKHPQATACCVVYPCCRAPVLTAVATAEQQLYVLTLRAWAVRRYPSRTTYISIHLRIYAYTRYRYVRTNTCV